MERLSFVLAVIVVSLAAGWFGRTPRGWALVYVAIVIAIQRLLNQRDDKPMEIRE